MAPGLRLYTYGACGTCRKAEQWLRQQGLEGSISARLDITATPPTAGELAMALEQLGRQRLLNTSGQRYRELGAAVVKAMADAELLKALAADGRLIKRPVLVCDDGRVLTGFRSEEWQALLCP